MSKVKQWATDVAEKAVDKIINQVKQNLITKETAKINPCEGMGVETISWLIFKFYRYGEIRI